MVNTLKVFTEKELRKGKFKTLSYNHISNPSRYNTVFKFAYYKDIEILNSKGLYINAGNKAYFKANEYSTIIMRVRGLFGELGFAVGTL